MTPASSASWAGPSVSCRAASNTGAGSLTTAIATTRRPPRAPPTRGRPASGLSNGSTVSGLVGFEYDSFFPGCDRAGHPADPLRLSGTREPTPSSTPPRSSTPPTASGARVFSSGTRAVGLGPRLLSLGPDPVHGHPADEPGHPAVHPQHAHGHAEAGPTRRRVRHQSAGRLDPDRHDPARSTPRITCYKVYRHAGTGSFQPGDPGVTLACQNTTGDCTDTPTAGHLPLCLGRDRSVERLERRALCGRQQSQSRRRRSMTRHRLRGRRRHRGSGDVQRHQPEWRPDHDQLGLRSRPWNRGVDRGHPGRQHRTHLPAGRQLLQQPAGRSPDTFNYTINGGSSATVSMTVTCVDDAPVAVHDTKTVTDSSPAPLTNRDFEVDTSGWASWNAPISRSTAEQHGGAASMRLDFNGTAWAQVLSTPFTAAGPNAAYTVGMWVKAPSGYRYSFGAIAIDASSAYISTAFMGSLEPGPAPGSMSLQSGTLLLAPHRFRSISLIPPAQPRRSTSMT